MTDPVSAELGSRPGKIIAVHLNYAGRAAQRGRVPEFGSYFLKAPSSLAGTGDDAVRPSGTELLGFEGEIALVIGTAGRGITPQRAWSHVGWVTAANDLGLHDLRYADRGSNLRSKSADGYTPLGPLLLPAAGLDPAALRVRCWHNGELVQSDDTTNLLFDFAALIADLSRTCTLERGDVILTGTPAGASVAVPGDVVEVEVDSLDPARPGSTGRLRTSIVEGPPLAAVGAPPRVDDALRSDAYGRPPDGAGVPGRAPGEPVPDLGSSVAAPDPAPDPGPDVAPASASVSAPVSDGVLDEVLDGLRSVAVATLSAQLRRRGLPGVSVDGVHPLRPGSRFVGRARTLRYLPLREDLAESHGGGFNAQKRAVESVGPGEVLVMEARGELGSGTIGDILALRAQLRGAVAIVTDGGVRDSAACAALDIPVFAATAHPAVLGRRHVPWDIDVPIACGGTTVLPGDILVGDDDGVLVIPPAVAEEVLAAAIEVERQEEFVLGHVRAGASIEGLYPPTGEWAQRYQLWRDQQGRDQQGRDQQGPDR